MAQQVKNLSAMQETQQMQLWSLGWEDPLEEGMAIPSCIFAWRIPWTEEPGGIQSMEPQSQTWLSTHTEKLILQMSQENHQLPHTENTVSLKEKENLSTTVLRQLHNTTPAQKESLWNFEETLCVLTFVLNEVAHYI